MIQPGREVTRCGAHGRSRINEGLIHLESISRRMTDTVPLKVVEWVSFSAPPKSRLQSVPRPAHLGGSLTPRRIDDMLNPHAITKSILNRAAGENQYALGRVLGIEVGPMRGNADDSLFEDNGMMRSGRSSLGFHCRNDDIGLWRMKSSLSLTGLARRCDVVQF